MKFVLFLNFLRDNKKVGWEKTLGDNFFTSCNHTIITEKDFLSCNLLINREIEEIPF